MVLTQEGKIKLSLNSTYKTQKSPSVVLQSCSGLSISRGHIIGPLAVVVVDGIKVEVGAVAGSGEVIAVVGVEVNVKEAIVGAVLISVSVAVEEVVAGTISVEVVVIAGV